MKRSFSRVWRATLCCAAVLLASSATAQTWPDRPIKLVVPFSAGGGADVAARTYGDKLSSLLGQPVVIENKPGASGNIGAELVARGPADGHTLLFGNEFLATNPVMFQNIRYDSLKDFVPIAKVASTPVAIAAHPSLPVKSVQELLALGRTRALNYASPGVGTGPHLFGQLMALGSGAKFNNIPYRGSAPAMADAVGGQVDFIISTLTPMMVYLQSGKLHGLAITGGKRSTHAPDIPTLTEVGVVSPPYAVWYGVMAPAATPQPVVARLQQLSAQILKDPEVLTKLRNAGYDAESSIGDTFGAELRADIERWQRVIQEAKIPKE